MTTTKLINDDVVTLEDAKTLKICGYKTPCAFYYLDKNLPYAKRGLKVTKDEEPINHNAYDSFIYSAPLKTDALRWAENLEMNLFTLTFNLHQQGVRV